MRLLKVLHHLVDEGKSVLLIEHNLDVIRNSDFVIDLGPGGGREGGELVYAGPRSDIESCARSLTGQALKRWRAQK
jgi:excinuclease ABC subunit A